MAVEQDRISTRLRASGAGLQPSCGDSRVRPQLDRAPGRKLACGLPVVLLLAAGLLAGHAAAASPTATATTSVSCEAADARLAAHQLEAARSLYAQVLTADPNLSCASQGLNAVFAQSTQALAYLEQGRDALARGDTSAARIAFADALAIDADLSEANAALDALDASPAPSGDPFAAARALLRAGYVADAEAAAKQALKASPSATLPPDLRDLPGQAGPIARAATSSDPWRGLFAAVADVLAAGVQVVLVVVSIVALWVVFRRRFGQGSRLEIGTFDDSASGGHEGPGVSGLIRAELARLGEEGDGPSLRVAAGIDAALALPAPVAAAAPTAGLVAALAALIGPPSHRLTGEIGFDEGPFGRHLTLALRSSKGTADAVNVGLAEYAGWSGQPGAGGYPGSASGNPASGESEESLALGALAAAAWVAYRVVSNSNRDLLPTMDWRSFALTRAGAELHEAGQRDRAEGLYRKALAIDPNNRTALFNLGSISQNSKPEEAVPLLERALELDDKAEERRAPAIPYKPLAHDRLWFRIRYNLAAAEYMLFYRQEPRAEVPEHVERMLCEAIMAALRRRSAGRYLLMARFEPGVEERAFLREILLTSLVILASVRLERPPQWTWTEPVQAEDERWLAQHLMQLTADGIMDWVDPDSSETFVSPRVHYNLACYWATMKPPEVDKARRHLELAVQGGLGAQVEHDPMLAAVRKEGRPWWHLL